MLAAYQRFANTDSSRILQQIACVSIKLELVLNSANRFYLESDNKLFAKIIIIYLYIYNRYKVCIQRDFDFLRQNLKGY